MTFGESLVQVIALFRRAKRVSYRALQRRFNLWEYNQVPQRGDRP